MLTVATKVALQMNCKMGGEPWAVKMPLKDTMVIGYDTYHDTAKKGRSVGAIVATMNQTLTRYMIFYCKELSLILLLQVHVPGQHAHHH